MGLIELNWPKWCRHWGDSKEGEWWEQEGEKAGRQRWGREQRRYAKDARGKVA